MKFFQPTWFRIGLLILILLTVASWLDQNGKKTELEILKYKDSQRKEFTLDSSNKACAVEASVKALNSYAKYCEQYVCENFKPGDYQPSDFDDFFSQCLTKK